ncbi:MAG: HAD family phosphatase [Candidatus Cloacimonas sp.]|jgi:HAD superfamily hydrolase (TIGR01509 family)|nr:HAD family phosphatase [Candidatus Cloacimonas sp.]
MIKYKAIIFDLDGTLIDSMQLWREVDTEFLNSRGIEVPGDLFAYLPHGNSFIQTAQYFKDRFALPDSAESIMQEWTNMVSHHYETNIPLKPGVSNLIGELDKLGIIIGLGTSNSLELAEKSLKFNGIWNYFRCAVTGDLHLKGKPFPDIYLLAAQRLGLNPEDCLVIEDTLTGVQAAKNAGMSVFAIFDADSREFHPQIEELADGFFADYYLLREALFSGAEK